MRNWGIFWGLILILLGVLFLLNSLGILPFNIWSILWPLAFILFGLSILIGAFGRRQATTDHLALQLKGFEEAELAIRYGTGRLTIGGGAAPDELLNGSFSGGVTHHLAEKGERALVELRAPEYFFWNWWNWQDRAWNLNLNDDIPLDLVLEIGAAESRIDLSQTQSKSLRLKTGASSHALLLPSSAGTTRVDIEGGAGSVDIEVPDGVAARISGKVDAGNLTVDQKRFPRRDESFYQSVDFEAAPNRVEIRVKFSAGEVKIR